MNMTHHLPRLLSALLLALALAPVFGTGARAAGKPLVLIAGTHTSFNDISISLLRRAFLGETAEYASGKRLIAINHAPGAPLREQFDELVLGLKPTEVGHFWIDRRIRDQPPAPKHVPSELVVRIVTSLPGAISYVTSDQLNDKVRVLRIDGKSPGQPGYLLAR
jgi:hypothetical protein